MIGSFDMGFVAGYGRGCAGFQVVFEEQTNSIGRTCGALCCLVNGLAAPAWWGLLRVHGVDWGVSLSLYASLL